MLRKPSSVPLFCQNKTTVILFFCNSLLLSASSKHLLDTLKGTKFCSQTCLQSSKAWTHQTTPSETSLNPVQNCNSMLQFFHWKLSSLCLWTLDCLLYQDDFTTFLTQNWKSFLHTFHKNKNLWRIFFCHGPDTVNLLPYTMFVTHIFIFFQLSNSSKP